MEIAQEVGRDINKDEHEGKHNTDYPWASKGSQETKDLSLIQ
jgi:hypothetical protein